MRKTLQVKSQKWGERQEATAKSLFTGINWNVPISMDAPKIVWRFRLCVLCTVHPYKFQLLCARWTDKTFPSYEIRCVLLLRLLHPVYTVPSSAYYGPLRGVLFVFARLCVSVCSHKIFHVSYGLRNNTQAIYITQFMYTYKMRWHNLWYMDLFSLAHDGCRWERDVIRNINRTFWIKMPFYRFWMWKGIQ